MAKDGNSEKIKRSVKSGLSFSKLYFEKSTSVVLITAYSTILFLALAIFGLSNLIAPRSGSGEIPTLPEKEPFAFLPVEDPDIPVLGDVEAVVESKNEEDTVAEDSAVLEEQVLVGSFTSQSASEETPTVVESPREMIKIVEKEVVKEVPREVVKIVEKEAPKVEESTESVELEKSIEPVEPEQTYFDNYVAPEASPIGDFPEYENFPDEVEEVSGEDESMTEQ